MIKGAAPNRDRSTRAGNIANADGGFERTDLCVRGVAEIGRDLTTGGNGRAQQRGEPGKPRDLVGHRKPGKIPKRCETAGLGEGQVLEILARGSHAFDIGPPIQTAGAKHGPIGECGLLGSSPAAEIAPGCDGYAVRCECGFTEIRPDLFVGGKGEEKIGGPGELGVDVIDWGRATAALEERW